MNEKYAEAYWSVSDLTDPDDAWLLGGTLSGDKARQFFEMYQDRIAEAMVGAGWSVIERLLSDHDEEFRLTPIDEDDES